MLPTRLVARVRRHDDQRVAPAVVTTLATLLAAACWVVVATGTVGPVADPLASPAAPGVPVRWGVAHPVAFLGWWTATLGALFVPGFAYRFRDYARALDGTPTGRAGHLLAFGVASLSVLAATGVVVLALGALVALPSLLGPVLAGGVAVVGGWRRLATTRRERRGCCPRCRGPFPAELATLGASARRGARFGARTLRGEWVVVVFVLAVGATSVPWLALLTAVLAVESVPGFGDDVEVAVGVSALLGGTVALLGASPAVV
jgi:predicted metal-binding membrane protein